MTRTASQRRAARRTALERRPAVGRGAVPPLQEGAAPAVDRRHGPLGDRHDERGRAARGGPPRGRGAVPPQLRPAQPERARAAGQRGARRDVRPGPARAPDARPDDHRHPDQRPQDRSTSSARAGSSGSDVAFNDDRHLLQIIQRIVGRVGRRVDETSPMVDARLPDGSRVNAIIPPLALDGTLLSIRRFGAQPAPVRRPDRQARRSPRRWSTSSRRASRPGSTS